MPLVVMSSLRWWIETFGVEGHVWAVSGKCPVGMIG